jgi:hypothetical protein
MNTRMTFATKALLTYGVSVASAFSEERDGDGANTDDE